MQNPASSTGAALTADWLAHRFDEQSDTIRFAPYDRSTRASVPFLIDQHLPPREFRALPRQQARVAAPASAPVHYIFHSAFCCSTLLAACFDRPGLATSFSEPMLLNDVVGWRRRGGPPAAVGQLLDDSLALLARPFEGDQAAILKPSNVVNGLAGAMMQLRPQARAILIHAPLGEFLTSIAKKGLDGRLWVRELFIGFRKEGLVQGLGFDDEAFFGQTDLQIAAAGWLAQQALFERLILSFPGRVRSIDSQAFLADPLEALRKAAALLGIDAGPADLQAVEEEVLRRNSKDGSAYGSEARQLDYAAALAAHGDEIGKVAKWAEAVADAAGIRMNLSAPLL
jgi:hypothetical protein